MGKSETIPDIGPPGDFPKLVFIIQALIFIWKIISSGLRITFPAVLFHHPKNIVNVIKDVA